MLLISLVSLLVLQQAEPAPIPETSLTARIVRVSILEQPEAGSTERGDLLVEKELGVRMLQVQVSITSETEILSEDSPISLVDLRAGQLVDIQLAASKLQTSYPARGTARRIEVLNPEIGDEPRSEPRLSPSAGSPPIRIGSNALAQHLVSRVAPEYPEEARRQDLRGRVLLQILIDEDGNVEEARRLQGDPLLASAVIEAVRQWKYRPFAVHGRSVRVIGNVSISFPSPK